MQNNNGSNSAIPEDVNIGINTSNVNVNIANQGYGNIGTMAFVIPFHEGAFEPEIATTGLPAQVEVFSEVLYYGDDGQGNKVFELAFSLGNGAYLPESVRGFGIQSLFNVSLYDDDSEQNWEANRDSDILAFHFGTNDVAYLIAISVPDKYYRQQPNAIVAVNGIFPWLTREQKEARTQPASREIAELEVPGQFARAYEKMKQRLSRR